MADSVGAGYDTRINVCSQLREFLENRAQICQGHVLVLPAERDVRLLTDCRGSDHVALLKKVKDAVEHRHEGTSSHLRVLKDANLVTVRAAGTQRLYAVNPAAIESLRTYFEQFWERALVAAKREVEAPSPKKKR
jgi:hypothetical protein